MDKEKTATVNPLQNGNHLLIYLFIYLLLVDNLTKITINSVAHYSSANFGVCLYF